MTPARANDTSRTSLVMTGFAEAHAAPEVVWSLLDAGFDVVCFSCEGAVATVRHEPRITIETVPALAGGTGPIRDAIAALIEKYDPGVVLPLDDISLFLLGKTAGAAERMPNSSTDTSAVPLDKGLQFASATRAGFRVPDHIVARSIDDARAWTTFPAFIKPALVAREIDGKLGRSSGSFCPDKDAFERTIEDLDWTEPWIVQAYVTGTGEGLFGHMTSDGIVNISGHRRLRMMNPAGSGSSACISVVPDDATIQAANAKLADIGWRGLFMIELLRAHDGTVWFMELNGRAWGSLALARRQGFEYPAWTALQQLDPTYVPPIVSPTPGTVCKHLGRDLVHLMFVMRGRRGAPKEIWPGRLATLFRVCVPNPRHGLYNHEKHRLKLLLADTVHVVKSQIVGRRK